MKRLVLLLFLISCAPPTTLYQRYATVRVPDNSSTGSAVSIGKGLFFTATHVIDSDSFVVFNQRGKDLKPIRLFVAGDVILFKADLDTLLPMVKFAEPNIGEPVYVLQPVINDTTITVLLFKGNVAYVSNVHVLIDRPIFPGISGSGLFNEKGELIGIASQLYGISGQVAFGIFLKTSAFQPLVGKIK